MFWKMLKAQLCYKSTFLIIDAFLSVFYHNLKSFKDVFFYYKILIYKKIIPLSFFLDIKDRYLNLILFFNFSVFLRKKVFFV